MEDKDNEKNIANESSNTENKKLENEDIKVEENRDTKETSNDNGEQKKESNEVDSLKEELQTSNNKLVRLQADFLNYKARTEKEKFATYSNAVADVAKDMLPIIDNLERAIESADKNSSDEVKNFNNGVKMIYEQFLDILHKKGLAEIEALDKKFDPNFHSGIAFEAVDDKEEDTIIEVFQKGYVVNEKVIRPSMVKISKK
ncbi:nucleotide exchange factor GrpE [Sedimentibacter sp. zth1]|nr:nucleotide exchange factor GrpE [Sedimentibacter sp. zth1]